MFKQIADIKFRAYLFFPVMFVSGCANSDTNKIPLDLGYCSLVEETINLDRLQPYYHVDTFPERIPLVVAVRNKEVNCKNLEKFGKSVKIIYVDDSYNRVNEEYLDVTKLNVNNASALVNFHYSPEGIRGEIKFTKIDSRWVIDSSIIVEM